MTFGHIGYENKRLLFNYITDPTDRAATNRSGSSSISTSAADLFGPLWFPRTFAIKCCMGGRPIPEIDDAKLISNWSAIVDEDDLSSHNLPSSPPPLSSQSSSARLTIDRMRLRTVTDSDLSALGMGAFDLGSLMSSSSAATKDGDSVDTDDNDDDIDQVNK